MFIRFTNAALDFAFDLGFTLFTVTVNIAVMDQFVVALILISVESPSEPELLLITP